MYRRSIIILITLSAGACAEPGRGDPLREINAQDTATETVDSGGDSSGETTPSDSGEETVDLVEPPLSFADDGVHELLVTNCTASGCHGSGAGGYSIIDDPDADYAATLNAVIPGDALASKLIKKVSNISSHGGGPVLEDGNPGYDLLVEWINDGAFP